MWDRLSVFHFCPSVNAENLLNYFYSSTRIDYYQVKQIREKAATLVLWLINKLIRITYGRCCWIGTISWILFEIPNRRHQHDRYWSLSVCMSRVRKKSSIFDASSIQLVCSSNEETTRQSSIGIIIPTRMHPSPLTVSENRFSSLMCTGKKKRRNCLL